MLITMTNQQIADSFAVLNQWNPDAKEVPYRTLLRLARDSRVLKIGSDNLDHDRLRLINSVLKDKSKPPGNQGGSVLSPDEDKEFRPLFRQLLAEEQKIEIHQIELINSHEGQLPEDNDFVIDLAKIKLRPSDAMIGLLLDNVLVEWKGKKAESNGEVKPE